jgi:hypothetical protein
METTTTTGPAASHLQELFDRVARHLLIQNAKSEVPSGGECLYKGPNGLKCAVGCLIKDEFYNSALECDIVNTPPVRAALNASLGRKLLNDEIDCLRSLQRIHDQSAVLAWHEEIRDAAVYYGLSTAVVDELTAVACEVP